MNPLQSRHNMRERNGKNTDKENLGELWDIYYNNRFVKGKNLETKVHTLKPKLLVRDLRLLLDLLATSSGIAPAIAIMTLFDRVGGPLLMK